MGFESPSNDSKEPREVPIGDPTGIDFTTGRMPAQTKLAELEKQDRAIDNMAPELIEDAVDDLARRLKENPSDPDALNQVARLRARLDEIQRGSTH